MGKKNGRIVSINGNMLRVRFFGDVMQNEVAYVLKGDRRLKSEVIKITEMQPFYRSLSIQKV